MGMAKAVRPIRIDPDRWTEVQAQAGLEGLKTNTLVENMIEEGMEKRRGPRPDAEPKIPVPKPVIAKAPAGHDVHTQHCYQGDYEGGCKYDDPDCTAAPKASKPRGRPREAADRARIHAVSVGPVTPQAGSRLKGPKAEKRTKWK